MISDNIFDPPDVPEIITIPNTDFPCELCPMDEKPNRCDYKIELSPYDKKRDFRPVYICENCFERESNDGFYGVFK